MTNPTDMASVRSDGTVSADEFNRTVLAARQAASLAADGLSYGSAGAAIREPDKGWLYAAVSSSATSGGITAYAWTEQQEIGGDFIEMPGGRAGTTSHMQLYEANQRTIPTGTVVVAFANDDGTYTAEFCPCA